MDGQVKDYSSFIGCNISEYESLTTLNQSLSFKVLNQVNVTQELIQVNDLAKESNEYQYRNQVQERISDINSWRWVLEDLSKRLTEAITALKHEYKAMRVVVERLRNEIAEFSRENSRPGALAPEVDMVEYAIQQENQFLRDQKKTFELMIIALGRHVENIERTKKNIEHNIQKKGEAVTIEVSSANIDLKSLEDKKIGRRKKKKFSPISRWENRCAALKRAGLTSLATAIIIRQQARGARVQLSIASQTYTSKVDVALRKRLHHNIVKLNELEWQRDETARDLASLESEQLDTEQSLLANLEHERLVVARLADRTKRPSGEHIRDGVDRKLRDELSSTRLFIKSLRTNLERIMKLQKNLSANMVKIECCARDLAPVICLDQERLTARLGEKNSGIPVTAFTNLTSSSNSRQRNRSQLFTIREEQNEEEVQMQAEDIGDGIEDYPFDY